MIQTAPAFAVILPVFKPVYNFHQGFFKSVDTVYERENLGLSKEQDIRRVHSCHLGNWSRYHATSTITRHFMDSTKFASNMIEPKRPVYK